MNSSYKLLHILLNDLSKIEKLSHDARVNEFFLEDYDSNIYRAMIWCFNKNKLLTEEQLEYFLREVRSSSPVYISECVSVLREISFLQNIKTDDFDVIFADLEKEFITRSIKKGLKELKEKVEPDFKQNVLEFCNKLEDIVSVSSKESNFEFFDSAESYLKIVDKLEKQSKEPDNRIACGIKEIDDCMVVGFRPGTLTLTVADVGGGKTTMMLNMAFNLFKRNHNVLFIPLEMPFEEIFKKFI